MTHRNNLTTSPLGNNDSIPLRAKAPSLTSVWKKDSLALRLDIWLTGVGGGSATRLSLAWNWQWIWALAQARASLWEQEKRASEGSS